PYHYVLHVLQSLRRVGLVAFPFQPFFFFDQLVTTEIYTLSLHDALPILKFPRLAGKCAPHQVAQTLLPNEARWSYHFHWGPKRRSEEHTSELQSRGHLVCRLLLEKKNIAATGRSQEDEVLAVLAGEDDAV